MSQPIVFLSATTSGFARARRTLRTDLGRAGYDVVVQDELRHLPEPTLLGNIAAQIRKCQFAVCIVGTSSGGGYPCETEAEPFKHLLPASMPRASYTQ